MTRLLIFLQGVIACSISAGSSEGEDGGSSDGSMCCINVNTVRKLLFAL